MIGRLKQLILLIVFSLTVVVFGIAYAATPTTVNVTVKDKSGDVLPFASVTLKDSTVQTGPHGEPATFNLSKGKYLLKASHILVKNAQGAPAVGKAKLTLKQNRVTANVTIKMKREATVDSTSPVLGLVSPAARDKISASRTVQLSVTAEDPESEIALIEAVLDGKTDLGTAKTNGKIYTWSKLGFTEGDHEVTYTAWNYAGGSTTQRSQFTIVPPVGAVKGTVRHANGLVSGATIKIDNAASSSTTDGKGIYTLPALRIGNHTITINANGLHEVSQSVAVLEDTTAALNFTMIDDVAPSVPANLTVTSGTPSSTVQTAKWDAATDLNGISYELRRYTGSTLSETKAIASGTSTTFTGLAVGTTYGYSVRAIDKAPTPNASTWSTQLNVATQKLPTVSWVSPTASLKIKATHQLKINFAAFGSTNSVKQIDWVLLPDTHLGKTNPTTLTGSSTLDWDTKTVTNGSYSAKATITDNQGNVAESTIAFVVDNPITSKVTGTVTYNAKAVVGASVKTDENVTTTTNSTGKYEVLINTLGSRKITVTATGLTDQTNTVNVPTTTTVVADVTMADGIAPTVPTEVAVVNSKPTASKQIVSWKASTDISGIKEYTVSRFTGTTLAESKTVTGISAAFTGLEAAKEYGYTVTATDKAAAPNKSAATGVVRQTTQQSPVIAWIAPTASQSLTGTIALQSKYTVYSTGAQKVDWVNKTNKTVIGTTIIATLTDEPTQDWDTSAVSNGAKVLQAIVTDDEDNTATAEVSVTVDNILYGDLTGNVSDAEGAVAGVEATLKKKSDGTVIGTVTTDAAGAYTFANVVTGDYNLVLSAEGYVDKTVAKTIAKGANTLNASLALLPRINGFTSTGRTLALPEGQEQTALSGMAVSPDADEMLVINGSEAVNVYNPNTEQFIRSYTAPDGIGSDFIAYDPLGFMVARYGNSLWFNTTSLASTQAWSFGYHGLVSMKDGSIISADANKIWRFAGRQRVPEVGYDVRPITGNNGRGGVAASENSVFVDNINQKLFKLNLDNPDDSTKSIGKQLSYAIGAIHYIKGTRTLLVAESSSKRLHLFDTRTLEDYASIENLSPSYYFQFNGNGLATYVNGGSVKLYISNNADGAVYISTSN